MKVVLKAGVDINLYSENFWTPLMTLISDTEDYNVGCEGVVRILIENNVDLDIQNECGYTALMLLLESREPFESRVRMLIEAGADFLNIKNDEGETAYDMAKKVGYSAILKLMKSKMN